METTLKFEELSQLEFAWWWFPALILLPDIGMLGYVFGPKTGAVVYNLFHNKALAIGVYLIGIFYFGPIISLIGVILFSHAALDRIFGYGLKYPDSFNHTHLGSIGKKN